MTDTLSNREALWRVIRPTVADAYWNSAEDLLDAIEAYYEPLCDQAWRDGFSVGQITDER